MGKEYEMQNTTIISMIEKKMPEEMTKEWIKTVTKGENKYKSKFLTTLLYEFRDRIEYKLANIRKVSEKGYVAYVNPNPLPSPIRKSKCWLHKTNGEHPIWKCRLFLNKSVEERIELTKENNACFSCFEVGHITNVCSKGFRCPVEGCNERHNRLLHENKRDNTKENPEFDITNKETVLPIQ